MGKKQDFLPKRQVAVLAGEILEGKAGCQEKLGVGHNLGRQPFLVELICVQALYVATWDSRLSSQRAFGGG